MAEQAKRPHDDLRELLIGGVLENICQAEEAMAVRAIITSHASAINQSDFSQFFARMQAIMGRYVVMAITRLYEPEDDRGPARSLPVVFNYMRFNADYLELRNRDVLTAKLLEFGHDEKEFEGVPDPWLTQLLRKESGDRLPDLNRADKNDLSKALFLLMGLRDRIVPHSDTVEEADDISAIEDDVYALLVHAKEFVAVISQVYLGTEAGTDIRGCVDQLRGLLDACGVAR